jgi:hypothetical protein
VDFHLPEGVIHAAFFYHSKTHETIFVGLGSGRASALPCCRRPEKTAHRDAIDQSQSIVLETEQILSRTNFLLKSEARNFGGSMVGFWPSVEVFCAYRSAHHDAFR